MPEEPTTQTQTDPGLMARWGAQRARLKAALSTATLERDGLRTEAEKLRTENADLKTRADTSISAKRVQELEGKIRETEHRKAFDRLATAKGARPDALDDLYKLSEYKAEKDEIDEAAITALVEEQRPKRGYLFAKAGDAKETPAPKPGPGSGQGGSAASTSQFTEEQLSDPKFVMANFEAITLSAQERIKTGQI